MTSREQALAEVNAGDIIFGVGTGGQPKLLLVYMVHEDGLSARHITTQTNYRFDPNGKTRVYADGGQVTIVSTARLDAERFKVAIGLDRKAAGRPEYPDTILTPAEIELMVTHRSFFEAHLLPA